MSRRMDRASRTSLLIRNLPLDVRPDDVRYKFERYGEIRDVYLPRDYYSNRPKGFGFVEYVDERDAEDALYAMDGKLFGNREIAVVMSKDSRKTPRDMMVRDDTTGPAPRSRGRYRSRSRSRSRGRRRRSYSRSRSRTPRRDRERSSRHRSRHIDRSPPRRERSYSRSPRKRSTSRSRSRDKSAHKEEAMHDKPSASPARHADNPAADAEPVNGGVEDQADSPARAVGDDIMTSDSPRNNE